MIVNGLNGVIYLNPTDRNPARIIKTDKEFVKKLDQRYSLNKKRISSILVSLVMKITKTIKFMYQKML